MALAGYIAVSMLPENVGLSDALHVGGKSDKLNVITTGPDGKEFWKDKYNIWSGLIGGFFLALSYFGTDQSQVGRYLTAKNNRESKLGLLLNGLVKVPMQFGILLIGILVFSFYQFNKAPISFDEKLINAVAASPYKDSLDRLQQRYDALTEQKRQTLMVFTSGNNHDVPELQDSVRKLNRQAEAYRHEFKQLYVKATGKTLDEAKDTDYIFLSFVKHHLPTGLKGLLIAVIFLAAWGSIAAALNSLAASTVCDFHQRIVGRDKPINEYRISKWYTLGWGIFAILVAHFSSRLGQSLIEAVNVLGSLFYGVILGIFLVAFYFKRVGGNAIFLSALIVEAFVVLLHFKNRISLFDGLPDIGFLWLNAIGAIGVVMVALVLEGGLRGNKR